MTLHLVVSTGPDAGLVMQLPAGKTLLIGRGSNVDYQLTDPAVSRHHLQIAVEGQEVTLTDLNSSGGTLVNRKQITTASLRHGDRVQLGATVMWLRPNPAATSTVVGPVPGNCSSGDGSVSGNLVGQTIHVYHIRGRIAEGRTALVYEADDTRAGQKVAFKVLRPEFVQDEKHRKRFLRAMETMFPLRHPHIIRIFNAGRRRDLLWIAMEYFPAESLTQVIERIGTAGMLDWTTGFQIAVQIARALDAAFERKIIHRNISPRTILYDREQKSAKLGGLMLAKALDGASSELITARDAVVGELAYLSPESLAGENDQVDCRSDIYSLGATVYALLTGRPPYPGRTLPELLHQVRNVQPEKPKKFQLSISDLFEGVLLKMLSKRPEDRYQTPAALLAALEQTARYQGLSF